ncbi:alpha/beta fold hydrolase [Glycomyces tenuis]|uniref:alpha/beta fold hydrolase n=1 Tax=Glycomyces tenuis TaxID=58116 RepID=UPI0003F9EE54|nr:alpha/beta hydrolase [Glycomyces tenuis]
MPRTPLPSTVHAHQWEGFRYCSRVSRSADPRFDPVVLIGGAMQRKEDWGRIEQGLLESADVVCPDLPGWGAADLLPPRHGSELLAGALRHLLDELGLERVNLFAGSYGTAIAYRLAQTDPERVARMALAGTMSTIPDGARPAMLGVLDLIASGERERFGQVAVETLMTVDPHADIASAAVVKRILTLRFGKLTDDELDKFVANTRRLLERELVDTSLEPVVPTVFLVGEHDTLTPPALCREFALTCRESWFVEMGRADHLMHLERSGEVVDLITRFFSGGALVDLPYATTVEDLRRVPALT